MSEAEPIVGTPQEVAEHFAGLISWVTNRLMEDLPSGTRLRQDRAQQLGYLFECAVFVWWAFDIVLHRELHAADLEAVRPSLAACLLSALEKQGFPAAERPGLDSLRVTRFMEYASLMQEAGDDRGLALIRATGRAWEYISDSKDPSTMGAMRLAATCGAIGESYKGLGRRVTILR